MPPPPTPPELDQSRKTRRQQVILLLVVNALVLAIGVVAAVDLQRLRTPGGTALRWVQAAVFGDCDDYLEFSVGDAEAPDTRSEEEICKDLRQATAQARNDQLRIGLHRGPIQKRTNEATVSIVLTRDDEVTPLTVHLVRRDGRWRVVRDEATCSSVGCA